MNEFIAYIIIFTAVGILYIIAEIVRYFDGKRISKVNRYANDKNKSLKEVYYYAINQGYSEEEALSVIQKIKLLEPDRK